MEYTSANDMHQPSVLIVNLGDQKVCLDVEEQLGTGAFGTVVRAVDNRGVSFAVKSVICNDFDTYESIAQEVQILLKLKHSNIVAMYGFDFLASTAVLIMEFCGKGTLNKRLDEPVEIMLQLQWIGQLTNALSYLHESNIVHRDLKTENILLSETDVKIADFGIARHFVCCKRGRMDKDANNYISEYLDAYMGTFAGTPFWVAPEVFDNNYTEKADIFSLGVIFYAICERQYCTFQGERYYGAFTKYNGQDTGIGLVMFETHQIIKPEFYQTKSIKLQSCICCMLDYNPQQRQSLPDIQHLANESYLELLQASQPGATLKGGLDSEYKHDTSISIDVEDDKQPILQDLDVNEKPVAFESYGSIPNEQDEQDVTEDKPILQKGGELPPCKCTWLRWILCGCRCRCNLVPYYTSV